MNAQELFNQDGSSAKVWYCQKCRIVHKTKAWADQCCPPCACGAEREKGYAYCRPCLDRRESEREQEKFAKAQKIPAKDYAGWVFCDGTGNSGYHESVDEFLEYWEDNRDEDDEKPEYVWACEENHFVFVDVADITERICENGWEDMDPDSLNGLKELEAAIDAFNKANESVVSYDPDYTRAIIL